MNDDNIELITKMIDDITQRLNSQAKRIDQRLNSQAKRIDGLYRFVILIIIVMFVLACFMALLTYQLHNAPPPIVANFNQGTNIENKNHSQLKNLSRNMSTIEVKK